jgi:hypothetical protein
MTNCKPESAKRVGTGLAFVVFPIADQRVERACSDSRLSYGDLVPTTRSD